MMTWSTAPYPMQIFERDTDRNLVLAEFRTDTVSTCEGPVFENELEAEKFLATWGDNDTHYVLLAYRAGV